MVVTVRPSHSGARVVPGFNLVAPATVGPRRPRRVNLSLHVQRARAGSLVAWHLDVHVEGAARRSAARAPVCAGSGMVIGVRIVTSVVCADNGRILRTRAVGAWRPHGARGSDGR